MTINTKYPRILIVMMTKIKDDDPVNLLIRTQFSEWPKDHLAQIHATGDPPGSGEFCGRCYRLQTCDRFLGGLFQRLRGGVFNMVSPDTVTEQVEVGPVGLISGWAKIIKKCLGDTLVSSGLWEVIFHIRLSKQMETFVRDFNPDMIYCQGYSLGFATLPRLISKRFNIPICFQTTDDWTRYTYKGYLMGWLLRRSARKLIAKAKVRLAFGKKMQQVFEKRYNKPFFVTYHADSMKRFESKHAEGLREVRHIVFTGSLELKRYEALDDLLQAVRSLAIAGPSVKILVYCSGIPKELPGSLRKAPEVKFLPLPLHNELPSILSQADVLFLPESFSVNPGKINLSLSTKCHLFMMSNTPVLMYGPPYSGSIEYGSREGWAAVVSERNIMKLSAVLQKLLTDPRYGAELVSQAKDVFKRNHDLDSSREAFRQMLTSASSVCNISGEGISAPPRRKVIVVSNGVTPYGVHFLERAVSELPDIYLRTIYSYEFSMGRWTVALPPSINALILGKSEEATGHGVSEIPNNLARGYQLIREIRSSHPDAVMVLGYGNLAHVMVIAWCRHNHIPCMMWGDSNILGDRNKGLKALIKKVLVSWVIRKCTAILSCGTLGARYFQRYGANSKQIFYVPNEPDYSAIENISTNEVKSISDEFLIAKDRHRLIFSGRLVSVKRVDLLIDAFVHIADRCPDWDLLIAGGGPLESELKSRVPHRLQHRIIWAGFIDSSRRMSVLYRLSDVLILPSDNEPWALVVNEAACAGLALVCSDVVGAAAQLLHDKINGRIFRAGDLTSLVNALLDVTDVTNLARYRTATPLILENWRKIADPVEGFRRALDYCWNPALAPDEQPEEELKGVY